MFAGLSSIGNCIPRSHSSVCPSAPPTTTTGRRYVRDSEIRVRCAPSDPRTRRASSTISPRIVSGSRMDVIRPAISRSERSVSARRAVSSRDRPSSRISSELWIAIAARSARAASRSPPAPRQRAHRRSGREHRQRAEDGRLADHRREGERDRIPARSRNSAWRAPSGNRSSAA